MIWYRWCWQNKKTPVGIKLNFDEAKMGQSTGDDLPAESR